MERDRSTGFRGDPGTGQQFDNPHSFDNVLGKDVIKARGRKVQGNSLALPGKLGENRHEGVRTEDAGTKGATFASRLVDQALGSGANITRDDNARYVLAGVIAGAQTDEMVGTESPVLEKPGREIQAARRHRVAAEVQKIGLQSQRTTLDRRVGLHCSGQNQRTAIRSGKIGIAPAQDRDRSTITGGKIIREIGADASARIEHRARRKLHRVGLETDRPAMDQLPVVRDAARETPFINHHAGDIETRRGAEGEQTATGLHGWSRR